MTKQENVLLVCVATCLSFTKLLMVNMYRSTDYEVHRNWLAITHSLPMDKWYTENTSEWTLDYPPLFAWFEFTLSQFAPLFDSAMLKVSNLNYVSYSSILFHRLTVAAADLLYLKAAYSFCTTCVPGRKVTGTSHPLISDPKVIVGVLLMANFGLFIIDHIHFQYNGFLFGILLYSILSMYQRHYVTSALHFATLLNFKHIFLYIAPAYGIYLLRVYCFKSSTKDGSVLWKTFSIYKFLVLAVIVVCVFGMSFGPFIYLGQLAQVISRLFPFKRGLCHAYWAPNFWALYNMADKALYITGRKLDLVPQSNESAAMTGGLVQEFNHAVLPSIKPLATFILTALFILPSVLHLWNNPIGPKSFLKSLILCGFTSFMFGWHVHEKAILLVIIPLALLAVDNPQYTRHFLFLSITGHCSLLPLIFTQFEQPVLYFGLAAYSIYSWMSLHLVTQTFEVKSSAPAHCLLSKYEKYYLYGLVVVILYYGMGHRLLGLSERLPFLPLLLMSVYTSLGVTYCYIRLYKTVLSESMVKIIKSQ